MAACMPCLAANCNASWEESGSRSVPARTSITSNMRIDLPSWGMASPPFHVSDSQKTEVMLASQKNRRLLGAPCLPCFIATNPGNSDSPRIDLAVELFTLADEATSCGMYL
eukprot:CAMPEP_0173205606 /NCGR_PEP_ID=MMETSP1141-20130122/20854_1 /TAXON_ID=483371 /ORGANISM="non described non described, Strain CCMP2298" /LENGTH=110 /DNA_ID=CAMNT_0014131565 /DNA_START=161 /DNA_END=493 /DNA_ORIENTATION=-